MSAESVSLNGSGKAIEVDHATEQERMARYRSLAQAFAYPDDAFFSAFPQYKEQKDSLQAEYDGLFRTGIVWLDGAEFLVENEFQRAEMLADIMGFYKAFAVEPDKERPDAFTCELEFMHYLILKRLRVQGEPEKVTVCHDAELKFFNTHLRPASLKLGEKLASSTEHPFYKRVASDLLDLIAREQEYFADFCQPGFETAKEGKS